MLPGLRGKRPGSGGCLPGTARGAPAGDRLLQPSPSPPPLSSCRQSPAAAATVGHFRTPCALEESRGALLFLQIASGGIKLPPLTPGGSDKTPWKYDFYIYRGVDSSPCFLAVLTLNGCWIVLAWLFTSLSETRSVWEEKLPFESRLFIDPPPPRSKENVDFFYTTLDLSVFSLKICSVP